MAFLLDPLFGTARLVHWLAQTLIEEAEREGLDEDRARRELLELQQQYDAGALDEEEYDREEKVLLERLMAIREAKAERGE